MTSLSPMKNYKNKNVLLTLVLSVVPGLPHLYLGDRKKAAGLFVIDGALVLSVLYSRSCLMKALMGGIYFVTVVPACIETYQLSRYGKNTIDTDSRWYTVLLLLTTGFSALPLLWQNRNFSQSSKVAWSIAVPVLAAIFFYILAHYWDVFERQITRILCENYKRGLLC